MLRIGKVEFISNVLLAPVAGHCDLPFRLVARSCGGVGLAFTDLLCPQAVIAQNRQTRWLTATNPADHPLGWQLYGNDPQIMAEAARYAVDHGATTVDINMGCPVDKVTKTFAGSMMLCRPDDTVRLVEHLVAAVGDQVPVTAKTRLGWDIGELSAPRLARQLVGAGVSALTIHGRTAAQRFKGVACQDGIAAVVQAVHDAGQNQVPCIGNGDIKTPMDAARMIAKTNCDGVMIARAALGAPWIFRDTHHLLQTGTLPPPLSLRQRIACVVQHFQHLLAMRDARYAINRIRQKISGYGTHLGPCKQMRLELQSLDTPEEVEAHLWRFVDEAGTQADEAPLTWHQREKQLAEQPVAQVAEDAA